MAKTQSTSTRARTNPDTEDDLTRDEIYETLSNRRRRYTLHWLMQRDENAPLSDLAAQIAAWENGGNIEDTTSDERKQVYTALQQFHLPKMEEMEIVVYNRGERTVELTEAGTDLDVYLDVIQGSDVPWSLYYVGFSAVSVVLVTGVTMDVYATQFLPTIGWAVFFVVALSVSALVHLYDTRKKKLGSDGPPLGVER